ncbi:hypothetical protein EYF80_035359 [Liparis tanakae]|uniref:Uncharacterized protein n=1 Tax=Liparis tanakae TaxID=230148 RepID=A0A4Z2GMJ4_9TELE|nr:hypothetical protein EYF80_035359 [Liparis tanakae]
MSCRHLFLTARLPGGAQRSSSLLHRDTMLRAGGFTVLALQLSLAAGMNAGWSVQRKPFGSHLGNSLHPEALERGQRVLTELRQNYREQLTQE